MTVRTGYTVHLFYFLSYNVGHLRFLTNIKSTIIPHVETIPKYDRKNHRKREN
jgi:hypothetical protein